MKNIVLLGSGNLATHLAHALKQADYNLAQIYSPTLANAKMLAQSVKCHNYTDQINQITSGCDLYLIALSDAAIETMAHQLANLPFFLGTVVHCSGSTSINILEKCKFTGVVYPLQSFSKQLAPSDFRNIPLFIEANSAHSKQLITDFANSLSDKVSYLDSTARQVLHLGGVMTCNFTNHLLALAFNLLRQHDIDPQYLAPLMHETVSKAFATGHPESVQTGPAIRHDKHVLDAHQQLLDESSRELYKLLSQSIQKIG